MYLSKYYFHICIESIIAMEQANDTERMKNDSSLLIEEENTTSAENRNVQEQLTIITTVEAPPNAEVFGFRQPNLSQVLSTTEIRMETQYSGASLIDLTINPISLLIETGKASLQLTSTIKDDKATTSSVILAEDRWNTPFFRVLTL